MQRLFDTSDLLVGKKPGTYPTPAPYLDDSGIPVWDYDRVQRVRTELLPLPGSQEPCTDYDCTLLYS